MQFFGQHFASRNDGRVDRFQAEAVSSGNDLYPNAPGNEGSPEWDTPFLTTFEDRRDTSFDEVGAEFFAMRDRREIQDEARFGAEMTCRRHDAIREVMFFGNGRTKEGLG